MKKILVSGAEGQLGRSLSLIEKQYSHLKLYFFAKWSLDITDKAQLNQIFEYHRPDYFINCAAYTAVDKAETEKDAAFLINQKAVGLIVDACVKYKVSLVHFSTDFAFDGSKSKPYKEHDEINPINVYGRSKLAGEEVIVNMEGLNYRIIRTSWVYAEFGKNFVRTMLELFDTRDSLGVVDDQLGSPTYARDLAECTLDLIEKKATQNQIIHFSNRGNISWYEFASGIKQLTGNDIKLFPINTKDYPTPASRPVYSVLDTAKAEKSGINIKHWKISLKECINRI